MAGLYDLLITSNFLSNGGGSSVVISQLDATSNGTYTAPEGEAYSPVVVDVPNTYTQADEGKVVDNGALVSQSSLQITTNGDYDTTTKDTINVAVSDPGQFDVNALIDGTMTDVTVSANSLRPYAFYYYTNLNSFTDLNITEIPGYCFSESSVKTITCGNVTRLEMKALSAVNLENFDTSHLENIGNYALTSQKLRVTNDVLTASTIGIQGCSGLARGIQHPFEYRPLSPAVLGEQALGNAANVSGIYGYIKSIGSNCLSSNTNIKTIQCVFLESVANNAFSTTYYVNNIDVSGSTVSSIGTSAFSNVGSYRSNPSSNILTIDFSSATFSTLVAGAFSGLSYFIIKLPSTITSITGNTFSSSNNVTIYMGNSSAPSLTVTTAFQGTYKVFVPWNHIASYQYATNWVTIWNNIVGYAPANTFTAGDTLPTYNAEGYQMTWYSDSTKTTQITECPVGSPEIYCMPSASQVKLAVTVQKADNMTLTITDSNSNPVDYSTLGFFICDANDTFTIDASTTQTGWTCYIKVDGVKVTTFPYTLTVTANTAITSSAYDPSSTNPDFAEATWRQIANAVALGTATTMYANQIGTEKTITLTNGETHKVRLSNCDSTMYEYADQQGSTGLVIEFTDCINTAYRMNATATNQGGWDASEMNTQTMGIIYNLLPGDVKDVISRVKVKTSNGGGSYYSAIVTTNDYLFLPAERETSATRYYSHQAEWDALSQWQYYITHGVNADRVKQRGGSNSTWWLRSSLQNNTGSFCNVTTSGGFNAVSANVPYGLSPCFCI